MAKDNKLDKRKFDSSSIEIPLLSIFPFSHLEINDIEVDFDLKVMSSKTSTENEDKV